MKSDLIKTNVSQKLKYILPFLAIVVLLFAVFYRNLDYVHQMKGVFRKI